MSRANPLDGLNLEEFQPKAPEAKPKADRDEIGRIAKENGFPSRQAPIEKPAEERPRQHYFRTELNEKSKPQARPRNALQQERQPMALWHEDAYRRG